MATQVEVVYPSISSFSGTGQLDFGPYGVSLVKTLLRAEVRGKANYQGLALGGTAVEANTQLWAVQWVPAGNPPNSPVTTPDGPQWLIREQLGRWDSRIAWTPNTGTGAVIVGQALSGEWGGQLPINASIDLYLSLLSPSGASVPNMNLFASLRFWWN